MILYININGDGVQSTEEQIVIGRPDSAIINKFFYELAKEIVKGVTTPGIGDIKNKKIVTEFQEQNIENFNIILAQWEKVKRDLLGANPSGNCIINLPDEYVRWLKFRGSVYTEVATSLSKRGNAVGISVDKIYRNAIGLLVNNIDTTKQYDKFVVNDKLVDDKSQISRDIRKRIGEEILFEPFDNYEKASSDSSGSSEGSANPDHNQQQLLIAREINDGETVGVTVYGNDNKPIYEKKTRGLDVCWYKPSDDVSPILYVGNEFGNDDWDVICFDGSVRTTGHYDVPWLQEDDLIFRDDRFWHKSELDFLDNHPEYDDCQRKNQVVDEERNSSTNIYLHKANNGKFVISATKGNNYKSFYNDVWSKSGEKLCTLPNRTGIEEILPSGLYVIWQYIDDDYIAYGIADKYGKILLPCKYGKHHRMRSHYHPFKEISPGVVHCCEFAGMDNRYMYYYDVFNRYFYFDANKEFLVNQVVKKDYLVDEIMDVDSRRVLYRIKTDCDNSLTELKDGWYELFVSNAEGEYSLYINKKGGFVKLEENEHLYNNYYSANDYNGEGSKEPFIGDNRIIAFEENDENLISIMIYSYTGELLKKHRYEETPIIIKSPYKYGKAPCVQIDGDSLSLCYLDYEGNNYEIPYKGDVIIEDCSKVELFMASDNTIVINYHDDYCYSAELVNLTGEVLFCDASWINPLSDGLLKFYCRGGYGIIDALGNMIVHPKETYETSSFDVIK